MDQARLNKLKFRAWHRGLREADLIVGGFANAHLAGFDTRQLDEFERLLEVPDQELWSWIIGQVGVPDDHASDVMQLLCDFRLVTHAPSDPSQRGA